MIWQVIAQLNLETCEVISESTSPCTVATRPNALGRGTGETLQRSPISVVLLFLLRLCDGRKLMQPLTTQIQYDLSRGIPLIHMYNLSNLTHYGNHWLLYLSLLVQIFRTFELPRLSWPLLTSASSLWTCIIPIAFKLWLRGPISAKCDTDAHGNFILHWKIVATSHCMPTVAALKSKVEDFSHRFRFNCRNTTRLSVCNFHQRFVLLMYSDWLSPLSDIDWPCSISRTPRYE